MTAQPTFIAVDPDALARIEAKIDAASAMRPQGYAPPWLTVEQYAVKVGKSPATVRRWCEAGRLRVIAGARPWRILQDV